MALQPNPSSRLTYKAHSTGVITANTQPTLSSDPAAGSAQELRRVSSTLALTKKTYESEEQRTSRQVGDMRHGPKMVQGDIEGEASPGTYLDLIEAALRCTKVATFDKTEVDVTSLAAANSASTLTLGGSTWAAQGYRVGDIVRPSNVAAANCINFLIVALSGAVATVHPAPTDMSADTSATITRLGNKMTIPASSHVDRKFLFEHYHSTIDIAELFSECRVNKFGLSVPASGMCKMMFGLTGRDKTVVTSGSAPFFTSPTGVTGSGIAAGVSGILSVAGTKVGIITGWDMSLEMGVDAPEVDGQDIVADIILGRSVVKGTLNVLLQDETFLNYFINETEFEVAAMLKTTSAGSSPCFGVFMPRVKVQASPVPLQGEGALRIAMPFQALEKAAATGYDATTLSITDNTA